MTRPQHATRIIVGLNSGGTQRRPPSGRRARPGPPDRRRAVSGARYRPDPAGAGRHASRQARERAATEDLHRRVSRSAPRCDGSVVECDVRHGDPATVLLAAAQHADLIVIGAHRTGSGSPFRSVPSARMSQSTPPAPYCSSPRHEATLRAPGRGTSRRAPMAPAAGSCRVRHCRTPGAPVVRPPEAERAMSDGRRSTPGKRHQGIVSFSR